MVRVAIKVAINHKLQLNLTTTHTNANLAIATATHQLTNTKQNMSDALWVESNVFQNDIEVSLNETAATKAPVTKAPRSRWVIPGDIRFDFSRWVMPEATTTSARPIAQQTIHAIACCRNPIIS